MIPVRFEPSEVEPTAVLFMPGHLGESLDNDQRQRAKTMAEDLGMVVIAYERPGTGSQSHWSLNLGLSSQQLHPGNYAVAAAQTGRLMEAAVPGPMRSMPRIYFGNSAGAVDAVAVTRTETVGVDYLAVGDPSGIHQMSSLQFGLRWFKHQYSEEKLAGSETKTNDGLEEPPLSKRDMVARAVPEVIRYQRVWRSELTFCDLREIARSEKFGAITVNVALFDQSFASTPRNALRAATALNNSTPLDRPAPFRAYLRPGRHSFFNDPRNRADFIRETIALGEAAA